MRRLGVAEPTAYEDLGERVAHSELTLERQGGGEVIGGDLKPPVAIGSPGRGNHLTSAWKERELGRPRRISRHPGNGPIGHPRRERRRPQMTRQGSRIGHSASVGPAPDGFAGSRPSR